MKKRIVMIAGLALITGLTGCGDMSDDIIHVDQNNANVFPVSSVDDGTPITMGDVMPFWDNGTMNIYHLKNISGTNSLFYHPISRISTSDFIHYTNNGIALNYESEIDSVDAALGTGSFIKDGQGNYHCFYTGHNPEKHNDATHEYTEVIRHAVSEGGQDNFVKVEEFKLYGSHDDFRDPYVYWDNDDSTYYMLVTTRDYETDKSKSPSVIKRYKASSLNATSSEWQEDGNFFYNDEGDYNMECPSYIEWNGYCYLAYSEQGENRVTHYRYKEHKTDKEWKKFAVDALDSAGFYAGRLEKADDKLYAFAWCARLTGGSTGEFDWAGNLVTHEIKQNSQTGELYTVMPHTYKECFNHEMNYKKVDGTLITSATFEENNFDAVGVEKLSTNVTRMSMKVSTSSESKDFGITFGIDGAYNKRLGDALISFDLDNDKIVCYNDVSSRVRYGNPLTSIPFALEKDTDYNVDVIIDGEVVSLYINDQAAVTARFVNMQENNFAFYANGATAKFSEIKIYE